MARIKTKILERFCYRMATGLNAGVDILTLLQRETESGTPQNRRWMQEVVQRVRQGESLTDALSEQGNYFPSLMLEMVHVGEQSGRLGDVFQHLADHYASLQKLYRGFLAMILSLIHI